MIKLRKQANLSMLLYKTVSSKHGVYTTQAHQLIHTQLTCPLLPLVDPSIGAQPVCHAEN